MHDLPVTEIEVEVEADAAAVAGRRGQALAPALLAFVPGTGRRPWCGQRNMAICAGDATPTTTERNREKKASEQSTVESAMGPSTATQSRVVCRQSTKQRQARHPVGVTR